MFTEQIRTGIPNVHIKIARQHTPSSHKLCNMHIHNEIELLFIKEGALKCSDGLNTYVASRGDIIFVNSRIPHITESVNEVDEFYIQFNTEDFTFSENTAYSKYLSRFINALGERMFLFKSGSALASELFEYASKCSEEYYSQRAAYSSFIKAYIYSILGVLYRNDIILDAESFFDPKTAEMLTPVLNYIEENYSLPITLDDLSNISNLNKYYFCRLFKKATNSTVTDFINFVRIYKAEKMLTSSNRSISDISFDVGFSSVSYFNRVFRKFVQLTPSQYRKVKYAPQT